MKTTVGKWNWETLSLEEKREQLNLRQKKMLEMFRQRNAISEEEYRKGIDVLNQQGGKSTVHVCGSGD